MKTHAADTSIACYHGIVQDKKGAQQAQILAAMQSGSDYSMQELAARTGLQTSTLSARLFELRESGSVEHADKRRCSISGVTIEPHRLAAVQGALFQ